MKYLPAVRVFVLLFLWVPLSAFSSAENLAECKAALTPFSKTAALQSLTKVHAVAARQRAHLVGGLANGPTYQAAVDIGTEYIEMLRLHAANTGLLLTAFENTGAMPEGMIGPRRAALHAFMERLAMGIQTWKISGPLDYWNLLPSRLAKVRAQTGELLRQWVQLNHSQISIDELVKTLRQNNLGALQTVAVQNSLKQHIADGLALLLRQAVLHKSEPDEFSISECLNASSEVRTTVTLLSPNDQVITIRALFEQAMSELVNNANEATRRRNRAENRTQPIPASEVKITKSENQLRIAVEDSGFAHEYAVSGVGNSAQVSEERSGLVVGRFHAELIADLLGLQLSHRAKPDGSGSIVEIVIGP